MRNCKLSESPLKSFGKKENLITNTLLLLEKIGIIAKINRRNFTQCIGVGCETGDTKTVANKLDIRGEKIFE